MILRNSRFSLVVEVEDWKVILEVARGPWIIKAQMSEPTKGEPFWTQILDMMPSCALYGAIGLREASRKHYQEIMPRHGGDCR